MTTSQTLDQIVNSTTDKIDDYWLQYFRENLRLEIFSNLADVFDEMPAQTKANIARRLGKRPEQITRWLSSAGNLEINTISDLALAMNHTPKISFEKLNSQNKSNHIHPIYGLGINVDVKITRAAEHNNPPRNEARPSIQPTFAKAV